MRKSELRKFSNYINKEIKGLYTFKGNPDQFKSGELSGIKDTVYLLGISISEEYECGDGFNKFSKMLGINWFPEKE